MINIGRPLKLIVPALFVADASFVICFVHYMAKRMRTVMNTHTHTTYSCMNSNMLLYSNMT